MLFSQLTQEEKDFISGTTGCGAKGADVPDWIFLPACEEHDFDYWVGGDKGNRLDADRRFLENMRALADQQSSWWSRRWYRFLAYTYYLGVRIGAAKHFWYGEKRRKWDLKRELRKQQDADASS